MPLILGTNSIKDTGYDVANSLRFNDGSSDYLDHTHNAVTSTRKQTFSFWVKRGALGSYISLISTRNGSGTDRDIIAFTSDDQFDVRYGAGSSSPIRLTTNRKFRDVSAWLHIVVAVDTTQATDSNRIKVYVNGTQETSFATSNYMSQNYDFALNSKTDQTTDIGNDARSDGSYFDGYFAEFVAIDGSQLDQTSFGKFDSDSPNIWKPIDVSGLTFGNAGFHLDFEDSSALGNDVSGNNNDFTVNNLTSVDQSTDTCTNNFVTLNPLAQTTTKLTLREGNLDAERQGSTAGWLAIGGTLGVSSGKWYYEYNVTDAGTPNQGCAIGWVNYDLANFQNLSSTDFNILGAMVWYSRGNIFSNGGNAGGGNYPTYEEDILMLAIDIDNGYCYFGKNGTWGNSGDPTSGSSGTGGVQITSTILGTNGTYSPAVAHREDGQGQANFGSPPFSISSGNSDGNGYGNFEYSVPSGYYALNTKNLAEYG